MPYYRVTGFFLLAGVLGLCTVLAGRNEVQLVPNRTAGQNNNTHNTDGALRFGVQQRPIQIGVPLSGQPGAVSSASDLPQVATPSVTSVSRSVPDKGEAAQTDPYEGLTGPERSELRQQIRAAAQDIYNGMQRSTLLNSSIAVN